MKNSLILLQYKIMLRKKALIESVNDEIKNICQIEILDIEVLITLYSNYI